MFAEKFEYVKKLGVSQAFDYRSPTVIQDIIRAFKNKESAGALAMGNGSTEACLEVCAVSKGIKFIAQASVSMPGGTDTLLGTMSTSMMGWLSTGISMQWSNAKTGLRYRMKSVGKKIIFG